MMLRSIVIISIVVVASAGPMKLYEKHDTEKYKQVLVPVSSTVIPLDDLPVYKVGVGIGIATPAPGKFKPDQPTRLITIHSLKKEKNKKKPGTAMIEEVTQEEYKKLVQQ